MNEPIDARAKRYATRYTAWDSPVIDQVAKEHYFVGAVEQRAIDLEKIKEIISENASLFKDDVDVVDFIKSIRQSLKET